MFEYDLSEKLKNLRDMIHWFAENEIRPLSIKSDIEHGVPEEFLMKMVNMGLSGGGLPKEFGGDDSLSGADKNKSKKESTFNRLAAITMEELAWEIRQFFSRFPDRD